MAFLLVPALSVMPNSGNLKHSVPRIFSSPLKRIPILQFSTHLPLWGLVLVCLFGVFKDLFFFLQKIDLFYLMYIFCLFMCTGTIYTPGGQGHQKRGSDPLELELQQS